MKIKLLNDGGYGGMSNIKFPVIVDVDAVYGPWTVLGFEIPLSELSRIGFTLGNESLYFSLISGECEVLE